MNANVTKVLLAFLAVSAFAAIVLSLLDKSALPAWAALGLAIVLLFLTSNHNWISELSFKGLRVKTRKMKKPATAFATASTGPETISTEHPINHHEGLNYGNYYQLIGTVVSSARDRYYRAATEKLAAGELRIAGMPDHLCQQLADALQRWVARGVSEFAENYPGMVNGDDRDANIGKLYRFAYVKIEEGIVVELGDVVTIDDCRQFRKGVEKWVQKEILRG